VYIGGYAYLNLWYHADGGLPAVYSAHFVNQPRAIGTFHSPNEFGAFLVIALFLALMPGILALGRLRPWIAVLLGIALLLSFSRSSWVGLTLGLVVILVLRGWRPSLRGLGALARAQAAPIVVFLAAGALILGTSNGARFVEATILGDEPSAVSHIGAIGDVFDGDTPSPRPTPRPSGAPAGPAVVTGERIVVTPLGDGLGTAGPKSARFTGTAPIRHSEIWYLNYAAQVGLLGLALAAAFVVAILATLWPARRRPWPAVGMAVLVALGAGAIFIPVIDEPSVAGPLWVILGLAVVRARSGHAQTPSP
jgi:O-antigen ligase